MNMYEKLGMTFSELEKLKCNTLCKKAIDEFIASIIYAFGENVQQERITKLLQELSDDTLRLKNNIERKIN